MFHWNRCGHINIEFIPLTENGGKVDGDGSVTPLWFTCAQPPKSVTKKRRGYNKKMASCDGDLEEDCPISEPPRKRGTKCGTWKDYYHEIDNVSHIFSLIFFVILKVIVQYISIHFF